MAARIVVRPVNDRKAPWVVHHFAAHMDRVADRNRTTRRDRDVIDDLHGAGRGSDIERLVHRVRTVADEEARRRGNRRVEIDLRRSTLRVGARDVHCVHRSRPSRARQEPSGVDAKERAL